MKLSFNFLGLGLVSFTKIHNRKLKRTLATEDAESVSGVGSAGALGTDSSSTGMWGHCAGHLPGARAVPACRAASSGEQPPGSRLLCKPDLTFTVSEIQHSECK